MKAINKNSLIPRIFILLLLVLSCIQAVGLSLADDDDKVLQRPEGPVPGPKQTETPQADVDYRNRVHINDVLWHRNFTKQPVELSTTDDSAVVHMIIVGIVIAIAGTIALTIWCFCLKPEDDEKMEMDNMMMA